MAKGIALQTILMLLVGILVVGIIVYLVYRYMVGPGLTTEGCRQEIVNWCTTCQASNWLGSIAPTSTVSNCWANNFFDTGAPANCGLIAGADTYCAGFGIS